MASRSPLPRTPKPRELVAVTPVGTFTRTTERPYVAVVCVPFQTVASIEQDRDARIARLEGDIAEYERLLAGGTTDHPGTVRTPEAIAHNLACSRRMVEETRAEAARQIAYAESGQWGFVSWHESRAAAEKAVAKYPIARAYPVTHDPAGIVAPATAPEVTAPESIP